MEEEYSLKGVYNIWRYFVRYMRGEIGGKFNKEFIDSVIDYRVDGNTLYIKRQK